MRVVKKFPCSARAFRARRVDLVPVDETYPEALFSFKAVLTRVEFSYSIRYESRLSYTLNLTDDEI